MRCKRECEKIGESFSINPQGEGRNCFLLAGSGKHVIPTLVGAKAGIFVFQSRHLLITFEIYNLLIAGALSIFAAIIEVITKNRKQHKKVKRRQDI